MSFTHLEVHSRYTLLEATPSVEGLAARAAAESMEQLALTDSNALYGALAFSKSCRTYGVQPIIGMTVSVQNPVRSAVVRRAGDVKPGQLVLLATDYEGYRNLCRLSSRLQGSPDRESALDRGLDWATLAQHRSGLIVLSGGRAGWLERYLRLGDRAAALESAGRLAGVYGDNARIALEIHAPADRPVAGEAASIGRGLGLKAVAVQPVYCLARQDTPSLRLLSAIRRNTVLAELGPDPLLDDLHWLSKGEIGTRFADFPGAVEEAGEIAAACGAYLPEGEHVWPALKLPPGLSPEAALAQQARAGLAARYGDDAAQAEARLEHELSAIKERGYAPLFIVVADIVHFSRESGVPVSTRGSVANSLVAYCMGITTVDPIEHDLLFERFLNPARADIPDIDLDFCSRRRDEVLEYVRSTYGPEHVAIIGTISTMQPQSAIRETGKALGLAPEEIARLAKIVPHRWHPDPRRRDRRTPDEVVASLDDPRHREVVRAAYELVGQPDHLSLHPGGVVITPGPLTDYLPVQWAPKGFLTTQFEHEYLGALGLPKIDLLGIRALTVLADAAALVSAFHEPGFRLEEIPLDDRVTGDLLARGETIGVFQCESEGAQGTLRKLRARSVRDLAVANAFFKPGPATGGMAGPFVRRYRGEEKVSYLHPALAPILGSTQGVLLFQEQILRVATEVAGLSWQEADQLRRGMSHFGMEQMTDLRQAFVDGCQRIPPDGPGFSARQAATLWEQVEAFAGYGFNQGHATAYADVSFRSAYLKAHWPGAFLCARLADRGGFHHPAVYITEAQRLGFSVRPPHVNHSLAQFSYEPSAPAATLWMGLGQVRDLRQKAVTEIIEERETGPYRGLPDLLERVSLQGREAAHLIQCGALDGLGASRHELLRDLARVGTRSRISTGQLPLPLSDPAMPETDETRRSTALPDNAERRDCLRWETHILGQPVSENPLALVAAHLPRHVSLNEVLKARGQRLVTAGVRLPGWTGGQSFFLADGAALVSVRTARGAATRPPVAWLPVVVAGRWLEDTYGNAWLQADEITEVSGFDDT